MDRYFISQNEVTVRDSEAEIQNEEKVTVKQEDEDDEDEIELHADVDDDAEDEDPEEPNTWSKRTRSGARAKDPKSNNSDE